MNGFVKRLEAFREYPRLRAKRIRASIKLLEPTEKNILAAINLLYQPIKWKELNIGGGLEEKSRILGDLVYELKIAGA